MPENNPHFLDSSIWLYAFLRKGSEKRITASQDLIRLQPAILSTQVINEVCTDLLNKGKQSEEEIRRFVEQAFTNHKVVELDKNGYMTASEFREKYGLSFRDSLTATAAFVGGARMLYSENIKPGHIFREVLHTINPLD
jgi:predicted nucleic acid-binding protein